MRRILQIAASVAFAAVLNGQTATFRSSTRLVEVNVVVRDKSGPVADLKREDFAITDRGKSRKIAAFSMSVAGRQAAASALPENTFSNRVRNAGAPGSVTIVLLDALNTIYYGSNFVDTAGAQHFEDQALAYGKAQLMKFVRDLNPKDRVAVYALGAKLHVLSDFTSDAAQLEKVIAEYRESAQTLAETADPAGSDFSKRTEIDHTFDEHIDAANQRQAGQANASRAALTASALLAIANHAADIPGRKNLVWLTASPPFSGDAIGHILARANLAIYPVDARGLVTSFRPSFRLAGQETLLELAAATGGRAFLNNNDVAGAIRTAVDDGDVSYTLGFYVDEDSLDDKFHEIRVRVERPGVEARYPGGYYAAREESTASTRARELRSALVSPVDSSAIHVVARMDRADRVLRLSGSVDLHDVRLTAAGGNHTGAIEIIVVEQDGRGEMLHQSHRKLELALQEGQYQEYLKSGVLFRENFEPRAGCAAVRILVGDPATGAMGSLTVPIASIK